MILSFKHKGLEDLFVNDAKRPKGIIQNHIQRITDLLSILNSSKKFSDISGPGLRLHPLKYDRVGSWGIDVDEKYRITFVWDNGDIHDVDYMNYHKNQ